MKIQGFGSIKDLDEDHEIKLMRAVDTQPVAAALRATKDIMKLGRYIIFGLTF